MARWTAGALGADPAIESHLDRRKALAGADFVVDTIQVGGARATRVDFDIPARYGLRYTINDTINVGGVLRGLRTIPVVLDIVRDMEAALSRRLVPELHEPDGDAGPGGRGAERGPDRRALPLGLLDRPHAGRLPRGAVRGGRGVQRRRQPPGVRAPARASRPRPVPGPRRVRAGRSGPRRRSRARRAVPAARALPDRIVGAPRRVQPVVHPQGRPRRALPRADRRVPVAGRREPGRVRRDPAQARRRRAVRDRAQRRVRGGHRPQPAHRASRAGSSPT